MKPLKELVISCRNPAYAWKKWEREFDIYLKVMRVSSKRHTVELGLLLNHKGEQHVDSDFTCLSELPDPHPAESSDNYNTVNYYDI